MSPYDIIPLVIVVVSLVGIIFIIVRKFPVLASIDVSSIKSEQEAARKEKIIALRLERKILGAGKFFGRLFMPVGRTLKIFFKNIYNKVSAWEKNYAQKREAKPAAADEIGQKIKTLFFSVDELLQGGKTSEAEKKCIEIVALDHKNILAYKKLGAIYLEQRNYENARATFEHILKLKADDVETLIDLGNLYKQLGENGKALPIFERVVVLEPTNPKNLDFLIEISIIVGNKELAAESLKKLKEANPENQKLAEFEAKIAAL